MCCAIAPPDEAARKGRPADPGLPVTGCAYPKTDRRRGSGFRAPIDSSFALAGEAVPFGHRNLPPASTKFRNKSSDANLKSRNSVCPSVGEHPTRGDWNVSDAASSFHIAITSKPDQLERTRMIIGNDFKRLEQRIITALYDARLSAKEAGFLQNLLRKIERYRDGAFISDNQASWLFTILTRSEQGTTDSNNLRRQKSTDATSPPSSPDQASEFSRLWSVLDGLDHVPWSEEEKPVGFDLSEAIKPDNSIEVSQGIVNSGV